MSYLPISKRCAAFLATRTGLAQEKEIILTYVIEVLVINLLNICLALLLGFFLGVLPGTVACLVTAFFSGILPEGLIQIRPGAAVWLL